MTIVCCMKCQALFSVKKIHVVAYISKCRLLWLWLVVYGLLSNCSHIFTFSEGSSVWVHQRTQIFFFFFGHRYDKILCQPPGYNLNDFRWQINESNQILPATSISFFKKLAGQLQQLHVCVCRYTCHTLHCETKSHRILALLDPVYRKIFKSHIIFKPFNKLFFEELEINHKLAWLK